MQLIKRKSLWCKEGTSDKIYEADLCQVGDKYVVNFRYGRRGTNLKEGVKTETPVTLPDAEKIFNKLIAEKVKKGYQEVTDLSSSTPTIKTAEIEIPISDNPREQAILTRLANQTSSKWQLSRAIWRAGELQIKAANPLLINLLNTGDALRDYSIIASLGWCGNTETIPVLTQIYQNPESPDFVKRIAFEAHLKLLDENGKISLQNQQIDLLPEPLKNLAKNGSVTEFKTALNEDLNTADYGGYAVLDTLYKIDNEIVRPALIEILKTAPFKPNYFQRFRHILKMAEYRQDAEIFSIFVYRLDKEKPMYKANNWGFYVNGRYISKQNYNYNSTTRRYDYTPNPEYERVLKSPN
ncbi:MAG TPA: WGR domain-containing protein, partial [Allocoleopsis sp.]